MAGRAGPGLALALAAAATATSAAPQPAPPAPLQAGAYRMDEARSRLEAKIPVPGFAHFPLRFQRMDGTFSYDPDRPDLTRVTIRVDARSITSGNPVFSRAAAGWMEVARYPQILFTAARFEPGPGDRGLLGGELSMHGVTRPISLDVAVTQTGASPSDPSPRLEFTGGTRIQRSAFGMTQGRLLTGDIVDLIFDVSFAKQ